MFLDINTIGREKVFIDEHLDLPALEWAAGEALEVLRVRLKGEAAREGRGVELIARLDARLEVACSRCLEAFTFDVNVDVKRILIAEPADGDETTPRVPVDDDDEETLRVPGGRALLEDVAAEQIYLSLPLKPVCSTACKGLCPQCGANRNIGTCGCRSEDIDPRLAPLLEFKRRSESS